MSAETMNEPTASMPAIDGASSMAEAASTMNSNVGATTTSGFHGLVTIDITSRESGALDERAR